MARLLKNSKSIVCGVAAIIAIVVANYSDEIRTGEHGLEIIGDAEGCRREAYKCPAGIWTYGIGTAETSGEKVDRNKTYTDEEIAAAWVRTIKQAEQCVNQYGNGKALPQGTFEAVTSITFNVGCTTMRKSTMYRLLNQGEYKSACEQFPRWVYASGKKLRGLEIRRQKERTLCLSN